jgi:hypothetical protein
MFEFALAVVATVVKRDNLKTELKRKRTRATQRRAIRSAVCVKNILHAASFESIEKPQKKLAVN